jgi:hypothetical protein
LLIFVSFFEKRKLSVLKTDQTQRKHSVWEGCIAGAGGAVTGVTEAALASVLQPNLAVSSGISVQKSKLVLRLAQELLSDALLDYSNCRVFATKFL